MRKLVTLLLIILLIPGCSNYRELNQLGLVIAVGIDVSQDIENGYRVTFQVINPSQLSPIGTPTGIPVSNYTAESKTVLDAYRRASSIIPRENDVSHLSLVVISEKLARKGTNLIFDLFERGKQAKSTFPVFIARGTSAENVLGVVEPLESNPTKSVKSTSENDQKFYGIAKTMNLHEVIATLTSEGKDLLLPGIKLNKKLKSKNQTNNLNDIKPSVIEISGLALFKKDKLVKWYDGEMARNANLILSEIESTSFPIPCGKEYITLISKRSKGSIKTLLRPVPTLQVNIAINTEISEINCNKDITDTKVLTKIETDLEKEIRRQVQRTIQISQSTGSDVFGFGSTLSKENPRYWKKHKKEWNTIFSKAKVEVNVKGSINDSGLVTDPYEPN
ncbi:Ger(x)C family spore germination protein [Neobacillus sp. DY30]|uniref:Ger(x)C family spore germination protein n=1 Tax=Neobacillus sp. DY30 TaxID=3047871 RepID=UPI0024BF8D76|nr:Ger(x)C family spore germination protein [Neobacillus sp. DY30]WHY02815.1 Ger(x)C family spore germination protein [Neobacillus sp. DY30]